VDQIGNKMIVHEQNRRSIRSNKKKKQIRPKNIEHTRQLIYIHDAPMIEFTYNNNFHSSIGMTPFEALYGRRCKTPLCWYESRESDMIGLKVVQQTTKFLAHYPTPFFIIFYKLNLSPI